MKTLPGFLLLSLIFGAGCAVVRPEPGQGAGYFGYFALTNNAGANVGTILWGNWHYATTNDIQYVLILPETDDLRGGASGWGKTSYRYCDLKIRSTGHQWKIEESTVSQNRPRWLRITDVTGITTTVVDLYVSRFWQVSEDGRLTSLEKVDDAIARNIVDATERHRDLVARNMSEAIK